MRRELESCVRTGGIGVKVARTLIDRRRNTTRVVIVRAPKNRVGFLFSLTACLILIECEMFNSIADVIMVPQAMQTKQTHRSFVNCPPVRASRRETRQGENIPRRGCRLQQQQRIVDLEPTLGTAHLVAAPRDTQDVRC